MAALVQSRIHTFTLVLPVKKALSPEQKPIAFCDFSYMAHANAQGRDATH
jgi:hypothetical protein